MLDFVTAGLRASAEHSGWAALLLFAAGACTSVGPCVAPRFIAAAGLAAGANRRESAMRLTAFAAGLAAAYACLGATAAFAWRLAHFSTATYGVLAIALGCAGFISLLRDDRGCTRSQQHRPASVGASLLLGASFAIIASPCCTPIVASIAAYASASGDPLYGMALMSCFALGHTMPLLGIGCGAQNLAAALARANLQHATRTASAALMLALAGYYAVLA